MNKRYDNTIVISALGEDKLADETIEALKEHGLNDLLPRVPYPTGIVQVQLDEQGIPIYDIKENVAWDNIPFDDGIQQIARNCRAVCFGSILGRQVCARGSQEGLLQPLPSSAPKAVPCPRFLLNCRVGMLTAEESWELYKIPFGLASVSEKKLLSLQPQKKPLIWKTSYICTYIRIILYSTDSRKSRTW